jgi:hypothetical protein
VKRFLKTSTYPWWVVFVAASGFATGLAYSSYNLFHLSMANLSFLREFGWLAVMNGGVLQFLENAAYGGVSLICFLGFKICETDLVLRYRHWTGSN